MRLIDADELKKKATMRANCISPMVTEYRMCVITRDIDDAQTIEAEPVKHGRWDDSIDGITPYCTVCGRTHRCFNRKPDYCPNCGAKMDL